MISVVTGVCGDLQNCKIDDIMCNYVPRSLERNAYNHVSATYYLLAERLLRKCSSLKGSLESKQPASSATAATLSRYCTVAIYVAAKATYIRLLLWQNGGFPALAP